MNEPTVKHEGYENFMKRRLREDRTAILTMVNNPPHYNQGDIEAIDAIHAV